MGIKQFLHRKGIFKRSHLGREFLSKAYLKGNGIEIGALHNPLYVSRRAKVKYVDRYALAGLKQHYKELPHSLLVNVDIVDDGELLATIANNSQDFVIANHFVEHCQNPILALSNMYRVLKKGGILYLALPDKRYTFDQERPVTTLEHILKDFQQGPEHSKRQHFEEWIRLVQKVQDPIQAEKEIEDLLKMDYSIHYHVWTQTEMLEMLLALKKRLNIFFDVETCLKNREEFILILRKMV